MAILYIINYFISKTSVGSSFLTSRCQGPFRMDKVAGARSYPLTSI
jgi:hypothetical protein